MESEYTKGEWVACPVLREGKYDGTFGIVVCGKAGTDDVGIADVVGWPEAEANAHLIAAAPDMYEALKELSEWLYGANIPFSSKKIHVKRKARQALAKAENK